MTHTSTGVDQDSDADRHPKVMRKERNLLLLTILEHLKVVESQAIHVLALIVENGSRDVDQLNVHVQPVSRILRGICRRGLRRRGLLSGGLGRSLWLDNQNSGTHNGKKANNQYPRLFS